MATLTPIYTATNTKPAFQLNWSLSLFLRDHVGSIRVPVDDLRDAIQRDDIRLLEYRRASDRSHQFFLSSMPHLAPAEIIRSVKGRCQYLLNSACPRAFRRNYELTSIGAADHATLEAYVGRQSSRHPMADERIQDRVREWQFHDSTINLAATRVSAHGRFIYNLHVVVELEQGGWCIETPVWVARRTMIERMAHKKQWQLSRVGIVVNHLHVLVGCGALDSPLDVGLAFLNNLAYVDGMRPNYRFGFYIGTFGPYEREVIRRSVRAGKRNDEMLGER
jgi:hypothetical protein